MQIGLIDVDSHNFPSLPLMKISAWHAPYVMLYDKQKIPAGSRYKRLQRWVNNRIIFNSCKRFEDFA